MIHFFAILNVQLEADVYFKPANRSILFIWGLARIMGRKMNWTGIWELSQVIHNLLSSESCFHAILIGAKFLISRLSLGNLRILSISSSQKCSSRCKHRYLLIPLRDRGCLTNVNRAMFIRRRATGRSPPCPPSVNTPIHNSSCPMCLLVKALSVTGTL